MGPAKQKSMAAGALRGAGVVHVEASVQLPLEVSKIGKGPIGIDGNHLKTRNKTVRSRSKEKR